MTADSCSNNDVTTINHLRQPSTCIRKPSGSGRCLGSEGKLFSDDKIDSRCYQCGSVVFLPLSLTPRLLGGANPALFNVNSDPLSGARSAPSPLYCRASLFRGTSSDNESLDRAVRRSLACQKPRCRLTVRRLSSCYARRAEAPVTAGDGENRRRGRLSHLWGSYSDLRWFLFKVLVVCLCLSY